MKISTKLKQGLSMLCAAVVLAGTIPVSPIITAEASTTGTEWPVTVTGTTETVEYDGESHTISGFSTGVMPTDTEVVYVGSDDLSVTGTEVGTYTLELDSSDFEVQGTYADTYDYTITTTPIELTITEASTSTDSTASDSDTSLSINATSVDTTATVTYDANGSTFSDGTSTTNVVSYTTLATPVSTTKYSHTDNVSDDGTASGTYGTNLSTNDVVTIAGAASLTVTLTFGGESANYDWVCAWEGNHPDYTAYNNYSSAISVDGTQKFGGGVSTNAANTVTFTVSGDSVTFGFRSDGSGTGTDGYGYYAVVTGVSTESVDGTYEIPTVADGQIFTGWNTSADGSGTMYNTGADVPHDTTQTVYAQYETPWYSDWTYTLSGNTIILTAYNGSETTYEVPGYTYSSDAKYTTQYGASGSRVVLGTITDITLGTGVTFADSCCAFSGRSSVTAIDISAVDTSNVTSMYRMFYYCSALTDLNMSGIDTSNVTNMQEMFYNCDGLTSIDLSDFDTSSVTSMYGMFYDCDDLTTLDLSSFDMSNVTGSGNMLYSMDALNKIVTPSAMSSKSITLPDTFYEVDSTTGSANTSGTSYTNLSAAPAKTAIVTADYVVQYTVTYMDAAGTTTLYTETVDTGTDASSLHTDHTWVTASGGTTVADLSSITADTTVYAMTQYTVTYMDAAGENTLYTETVESGTDVSSLHTDHTWVTASAGTTVADLSSITADTTVYAMPQYTVTYMDSTGTTTLYTETVESGADASSLHTDYTWVTDLTSGTAADLTSITADTKVYAVVNTISYTLTCETSGNMASPDKYFKFLVGFRYIGSTDTTMTATVNLSNADATVVSTPSTLSSYVGQANTTSYTIVMDGTSTDAILSYPIYLQSGQSVTISGIPAGVEILVSVEDEGYTPTITVSGDTTNTTDGDIASVSAATYTDTSMSEDTTATVTLDMQSAVATGIDMNDGIYIIIAAAAIAAVIAAYEIKRRRAA